MSSDDDFMKELQQEFLDQMVFMLDECEESYLKLEKPSTRPEELTKIFRLAHSIKGSGGVAGFLDLAGFAHCVEDLLTILRSKPELVNESLISLLLRAGDAFKVRIHDLREKNSNAWDVEGLRKEIVDATQFIGGGSSSESSSEASSESVGAMTAHDDSQAQMDAAMHEEVKATTVAPTAAGKTEVKQEKAALVRVDPLRIDAVLDLVGELVVIKGQLLEENSKSSSQREREILALLDKTARELQDKTLAMRLTSLKPLFLRMQRIIRDLSLELEKPVDFIMEGEDIELDRSMIELLTDPLTHIVRNAIDHGLENWEDREKVKKPVTGQIRMTAKQSGGRIVIELRDDGKGIDRKNVLKKAVSRGLITQENGDLLSNEEVFQLLFLPGFSTAEKVTAVSGRGVGLDVVKTNVEKLKGSISIESTHGSGSLFRISLPLTTAITDGIIVLLDNQRFVVPMSSIIEIVQLDDHEIIEIGDRQYAAMIRGKSIALMPMGEILGSAQSVFSILQEEHQRELKTVANSEGQPATEPSEATSTGESDRALKRRRHTVLVVEHSRLPIALLVDSVLGQSQVVVKALGERFKNTIGLAGASIMGDGKIALVLDVEALTHKIRTRRLVKDAKPAGTQIARAS